MFTDAKPYQNETISNINISKDDPPMSDKMPIPHMQQPLLTEINNSENRNGTCSASNQICSNESSENNINSSDVNKHVVSFISVIKPLQNETNSSPEKVKDTAINSFVSIDTSNINYLPQTNNIKTNTLSKSISSSPSSTISLSSPNKLSTLFKDALCPLPSSLHKVFNKLHTDFMQIVKPRIPCKTSIDTTDSESNYSSESSNELFGDESVESENDILIDILKESCHSYIISNNNRTPENILPTFKKMTLQSPNQSFSFNSSLESSPSLTPPIKTTPCFTRTLRTPKLNNFVSSVRSAKIRTAESGQLKNITTSNQSSPPIAIITPNKRTPRKRELKNNRLCIEMHHTCSSMCLESCYEANLNSPPSRRPIINENHNSNSSSLCDNMNSKSYQDIYKTPDSKRRTRRFSPLSVTSPAISETNYSQKFDISSNVIEKEMQIEKEIGSSKNIANLPGSPTILNSIIPLPNSNSTSTSETVLDDNKKKKTILTPTRISQRVIKWKSPFTNSSRRFRSLSPQKLFPQTSNTIRKSKSSSRLSRINLTPTNKKKPKDDSLFLAILENVNNSKIATQNTDNSSQMDNIIEINSKTIKTNLQRNSQEEIHLEINKSPTETLSPKKTRSPNKQISPVKNLIRRIYKPGEILWGRIGNYPYWPCIVCPDERGVFIAKFQKTARKIHIKFFADNGRHAWININSVIDYKGLDDFYERAKTYDSSNVKSVCIILLIIRNNYL